MRIRSNFLACREAAVDTAISVRISRRRNSDDARSRLFIGRAVVSGAAHLATGDSITTNRYFGFVLTANLRSSEHVGDTHGQANHRGGFASGYRVPASGCGQHKLGRTGHDRLLVHWR